jgi:phage-related baseplate assembly protein
VTEADVVPVDVTLTAHPMPGWDADEVRAAAETAVADWLNPETWIVGAAVVPAQLSDRVSSIPSVDYVTLDEPAATVDLDINQVAAVGALTVSVAS